MAMAKIDESRQDKRRQRMATTPPTECCPRITGKILISKMVQAVRHMQENKHRNNEKKHCASRRKTGGAVAWRRVWAQPGAVVCVCAGVPSRWRCRQEVAFAINFLHAQCNIPRRRAKWKPAAQPTAECPPRSSKKSVCGQTSGGKNLCQRGEQRGFIFIARLEFSSPLA